MSEIAKTIGRRVRNYRIEKGLSQEKLAELSGCHPTYIGQVERGEKNATLESIEKIASAMNVSLAQLFEKIGESSTDSYPPQFIQWVDSVALPYLQRWYEDLNRLLPSSVSQGIAAALDALKQSLLRWAGSLSAAVTGGAFSTAMSLPNALLGVVLTVMGTYYFSADRERIRGFFRRTLPVSWRQRYGFVRKNLLTALFGQVKSQLTVSLIVTAALTLAFVIYGIPYGLAAGVLIGVADALPVIGAGLFLIPWSLLSFIGGSTGMGVFMACAYVGVIVIRQIAEPRIVGRQLGLYPLLTMMAMYAGYRLTGFLGLLLGPVLLQVMKAVLEADAAAQSVSPSENR